MRNFIKYTFASLFGFILAGVFFIILGMIALTGLLTAENSKTIVKDSSVFILKLNGSLYERTTENPLQEMLGEDYKTYGLDDILSSIQKAKTNPSIKGIYLEPSFLECSFASIEEIRESLLSFKESGKFIIAYADQFTQNMYFLASVADKIILNPLGTISWHGLSSQPVYYTDLLKKLGIEMQIFKVGTYKSAVEPFTSTQMSEANREQTEKYLQSIWENITKAVATDRGLTSEQLNHFADQPMDFQQAAVYVQNGLVDTLMYKNEVISYLKKLTGRLPYVELNQLSLKDMQSVPELMPKAKASSTIAVYYTYGSIDDIASGPDGIDSKKVVKDFRKLCENPNIKAVVLRVNSPGGSAFGSEQIWYEVQKLKGTKPIIVSMGDYAASGGYYISCAADYIVAHPTTLTGSIGIFGIIPNLENLMTDKLDLHFDLVKTNKFSDIGNLTRPFNLQEKEALQNHVNNGYKLFTKRCADGRKMSVEDIEKIAEGRVWSGENAKQIGLVDELGGLSRAIQIAAERAHLYEYRIASYPDKENFLFTLLNEGADDYIHSKITEYFGAYTKFSIIQKFKEMTPLQARLPFEPCIN